MTVFFTADTHFGHPGARALYRRPFASVAEMDRAMVANWNTVVGVDDEVWHLGDFAVKQTAARIADLLASLNGRKHLVRGNNDDAAVLDAAWDSITDYAEIQLDGRSLVLCHYAFRSWGGMGKGAINLHGHSHGRLQRQLRQVDVGVDNWGFAPISLATATARRPATRAT